MKPIYFLAFIVLPLVGCGQTSLSEPLRANPAQPEPSQTALPAPKTQRKATPVESVDPVTAIGMMTMRHYVVLDVRTPEEYAAGHLSGAKNLDFRAPDFKQQVAKLNPQGKYLLYCASGNRSSQAASVMQQQGFQNVVNAGGYTALRAAGAK
jgi:phage shock protein E